MSEPPAQPPRSDESSSAGERYYRGVISRVFYGSESGTLVSDATGREYQFKWPYVQILGPIPRVGGLREGMTVGFDVGWTSRGRRVTVIKIY